MSDMYVIEYRIPDYSVADAFRPNPMWGRRVFTIRTEDIGTDDEVAIEKAAIETTPKGYLFHSMKKKGAH